MNLTDRERQIIEFIRRDPMIGAQALADRLGSTRSAVLVHLSNLGKKGVLLGRGYILREEQMVLVIGGSTLDLKVYGSTGQNGNKGVVVVKAIAPGSIDTGRGILRGVSLMTLIATDATGNSHYMPVVISN